MLSSFGLVYGAVALAAPIQLSHSGRLLDGDGTALQGTVNLDVDVYVQGESTPVHPNAFTGYSLNDGYYSVFLDVDTDTFLAPTEVQVRVNGADIGGRQALVRTSNAAVADVAARVAVSVSTPSGDCGAEGGIMWSRADASLYVCDDSGEWQAAGSGDGGDGDGGGGGDASGAGVTVGYYGIDDGSTGTSWAAIVTLGTNEFSGWTNYLDFQDSVSTFCVTHGYPLGAIKTRTGDMGTDATYFTAPGDAIIAGNGPAVDWLRLVGPDPHLRVYTRRRHTSASNTGTILRADLNTSGHVQNTFNATSITDADGRVMCQTDIPISSTPSL